MNINYVIIVVIKCLNNSVYLFVRQHLNLANKTINYHVIVYVHCLNGLLYELLLLFFLLYIWYARDLHVIKFSCFLSIMCGNANVAGIARERKYIVYTRKDHKSK